MAECTAADGSLESAGSFGGAFAGVSCMELGSSSSSACSHTNLVYSCVAAGVTNSSAPVRLGPAIFLEARTFVQMPSSPSIGLNGGFPIKALCWADAEIIIDLSEGPHLDEDMWGRQ